MKQIYKFKDWTSASKMRNAYSDALKIDVSVIKNNQDEINGYQLSVYNNVTQAIVYKFYIDYGDTKSWSLSTIEAITALNQMGFYCEFDMESYSVSERAIKTLNALLDLGYTHIMRDILPQEVRVYRFDGEIQSPRLDELSKIEGVANYNYHDYWFLTTTLTPIQGILTNLQ